MIALAMLLALTVPQQQGLAQKPVPIGQPEDWISSEDYPPAAKGAEGAVVYRLAADNTGTVLSCTIVVSSGSQVLDDRTCFLMMHRAHFKPAKDGQGQPIPFSWQSRFLWTRPR